MPDRFPPYVAAIDSRTIRIGDLTVRTTFPIDHIAMVDERMVLAVETVGDEEWYYQSFAVDPKRETSHGRLYVFTARVARGTRISLPATHNRGIVLPSKVEATLPGAVFSVAEAVEGFVAIVDPLDVPVDNAFFVAHDGFLRWQIKQNPFTGVRTLGGYDGAYRAADGSVYVSLDRAAYFLVDQRDGSIIEHLSRLP